MYIYNVTVNIDESIAQEWLTWMQESHIPEMLSTGKFFEAKMCQVMIEEEMGGITYSIQYTSESKEALEKYYEENSEDLRKKSQKIFGDKFVAFRTELKVISYIKNFVKS
ncbi:MAG: DUF4286 family protein [Aureibaculum sp.]